MVMPQAYAYCCQALCIVNCKSCLQSHDAVIGAYTYLHPQAISTCQQCCFALQETSQLCLVQELLEGDLSSTLADVQQSEAVRWRQRYANKSVINHNPPFLARELMAHSSS